LPPVEDNPPGILAKGVDVGSAEVNEFRIVTTVRPRDPRDPPIPASAPKTIFLNGKKIYETDAAFEDRTNPFPPPPPGAKRTFGLFFTDGFAPCPQTDFKVHYFNVLVPSG
jgi:hypothetical protein